MVDETPAPKADVAKKADNVAKKAAEAAPPKEANIQLEGNPDKKTVEETWVRGTTNAAMVTEPPIPALKPVGGAPAKALIQLEKDMDAEPVEKTWIRTTTNAAMVKEPPIPPKATVKESAKTKNDKKRVDVYPTKDASAEEETNVQLETNPYVEPVE